MDTLVSGPTTVLALVYPTTNAEEMTRRALGSAELDISLHLNYQAIESSA